MLAIIIYASSTSSTQIRYARYMLVCFVLLMQSRHDAIVYAGNSIQFQVQPLYSMHKKILYGYQQFQFIFVFILHSHVFELLRYPADYFA